MKILLRLSSISVLMASLGVLLSSFLTQHMVTRQSLWAGVVVALVTHFVLSFWLEAVWSKPSFYWVWISTMLIRLLVLFATAGVVLKCTQFETKMVLVGWTFVTLVGINFDAYEHFKKKT